MIREALILIALGGAALAQTMSDRAALLAAAIEKAGCTVTLANGNDLAAGSGLSEEAIKAATVELYQLGLLKMNDNGASADLTTPACQ